MTNTLGVKLTYDDSLMFSSNLKHHGISEEKLKQMFVETEEIYESVRTKLNRNEYSFVNLANDLQAEKACKEMWARFRNKTKRVVIVGIGGAYQTAQMMHQAFFDPQKNIPLILCTGTFTDPDELDKVMNFVKGHEKEVLVITLSKSGTTVEPVTINIFLKDHFRSLFNEGWKEHFIYVTDEKKGLLIKEVKEYGLYHLPSSLVGDRFAPLSVLGILSYVIMDVDTSQVLKGAKGLFTSLTTARSINNIPWRIALYQYIYQKIYGINVFSVLTYQSRLEEFNMWLRQLWSESLGKEGKGIVLFPTMGPKDQHSILQMFNAGPWFSTFLFISQKKYNNDRVITNHGITELNHFNAKSLSFITASSCRNTQLTLKNYDRPSAHLQFSQLDELTFGTLIALFEMAVVYLGELLKLENIFNQPGVTESREFIDASLGRHGSQETQFKLEALEKSIKKSFINYP